MSRYLPWVVILGILIAVVGYWFYLTGAAQMPASTTGAQAVASVSPPGIL